MRRLIYYIILISVLLSCQKVDITKKDKNAGLDNVGGVSGIISLPDSAHEELQKHFSKYTNIETDEGQLIHILAQSGVSSEKVNKVRDVLQFYLQNYPSAYGTDKTEIANSLANKKATMYLLNDKNSGEDALADLKGIDLSYQVLYESEIIVDGSQEYISNYLRDATYQEVLYLVQDYGIAEILPEYQAKIRTAADGAIMQGYWNSVMIPEWEKEGNIEVEYLATVLDVYYGLWQNATTDLAFNGEYIYSSREAVKLGDPMGYGLMNEQFIPPYISYEVSIHDEFTGTFRMEYDTSSRYSVKSQYLSDIRLTGSNNTNVILNGYDNYIVGNTGQNKVYFTGNWEDYDVIKGNPAIIIDLIENRDGTDTLVNIELMQFSDTIVQN